MHRESADAPEIGDESESRGCVATETAFVVVSCDKYSDLWESFFNCCRKYWPDCPFPQYLVTNHERREIEGVRVIAVGPDRSYSDNIRSALQSIPQKSVILWLDDVFICQSVDTHRLLGIIKFAQQAEAGFVKLSADMPMSYAGGRNSDIGPLPKGIRYRAAIGCAWYEKNTLLQLLIPGASAWELDRSNACDELSEPFFALTPRGAANPPIRYCHLLVKGRWTLAALSFLKRESLELSPKSRKVQSIPDYLYGKLYAVRLRLFYRLLRRYWY